MWLTQSIGVCSRFIDMKPNQLSRQASLNKENVRNSINRKARESIGSQGDDHLLTKLIPDFGLSTLTRNISEMLDLPERTDLNRGNSDGSCDIFSANVIDVVKDLGQEVSKSAQDITIKTAQDISKTAQDISKTAQDLSKTARTLLPLPNSLSSSSARDEASSQPTASIKVKAPRNYNVNFIFTEVERSREEEFLNLTIENCDDSERNHEEETSSNIPSDFRTPTKTYEQLDMFNLLYTPATCCSQSSACVDGSVLDQSDYTLNQSIICSAEKSLHSLEDSPLKLNDDDQYDDSDEVVEVEDVENIASVESENDGASEVSVAPSLQSPPELDSMDILLQNLFGGDATPLDIPFASEYGKTNSQMHRSSANESDVDGTSNNEDDESAHE